MPAIRRLIVPRVIAVLLAVPHRSSPVANLRISVWLSQLIRLPKTLTIDLLDATLMAVGNVMHGGEPTPPRVTAPNSNAS